jgi:hypothetical protein
MRFARRGAVCFAPIFGLSTSAHAQQSESAGSVESLRAALQKWPPSILIPALPWVAPNPRRLGILTLVPPDTNGEMIKVVVPVGELVSRAAHGVANAQRRRAEQRARENVSRELREFLAQRPTR